MRILSQQYPTIIRIHPTRSSTLFGSSGRKVRLYIQYFQAMAFRLTNLNRQLTKTLLEILIMIASLCIQGLYSDCPSLCECKWKSGKESVICLNANLSTIPLHLDAGTQVLDLTGNNIVTIKHDEFSTAGLINLQKVYIAKCRLKTLDRYAFRHLINVIELDLSYNTLAAVPSHTFDSIPELRELRLNGNPIQRVVNDAFIHVPRLIRLELTNCKISHVEPRAFSGLENSLEWLNLDNNRITDIRSTTITSLRTLHGIELANNPWNCSCTLRPLREWMLRHNVPYGVPPVCRTPQRLAGKLWDRLELDEFACAPAIEAYIPKAYGVEGRNVTMSCRIGGVPEPNVRWLLKNRVIANLSGVPYGNNGKKLYIVHLQNQASNLTILTADVQDAGVYVCTAENKAGRAEASVTLAVSRRPADGSLATRMLVLIVIIALICLLGVCLLVVCVCNVRKRQSRQRNTLSGVNSVDVGHQGRDENYEKIEMNNKVNRGNYLAANNGVIASGQQPSVAVSVLGGGNVGSGRRRGDYRGIPTVDTDMEGDEEDDAGYEDDVENTPTPSTATRDTIRHWSSYTESKVTSPLNVRNWNSESNALETDLHIPRRSNFTESNRDDRTSIQKSTSGTFNDLTRNSTNFEVLLSSKSLKEPGPSNLIHSGAAIAKPPTISSNSGITISTNNLVSSAFNNVTSQVLHPHIMRKQVLEKGGGSLYTTAGSNNSPTSSERNYPDLLELPPTTSSAYNYDQAKNVSMSFGDAYGRKQMEQLNCTLPRKRTSTGIYGRASSKCHNSTDSEAPLLADSRYSSSGGEDNSDHTYQLNRRLSVDGHEYTDYHTKNSSGLSNINDSQRANSYLNLNTDRYNSSLRNQSLPTSPLIDLSCSTVVYSNNSNNRYDNSATPLLNINNLDTRNNYLTRTRSPDTSTNANTYDYHAAQLERFLEEYRSLQAQLNKMKETCEGMRQSERKTTTKTDTRPTSGAASISFVDPLLYNNVVPSPAGLENSPDDGICQPKSILKSKNSATAGILSPLTGNPDAPSPLTLTPGDFTDDLAATGASASNSTAGGVNSGSYWLPRNTLLKRFNGNTGGNSYNFQS